MLIRSWLNKFLTSFCTKKSPALSGLFLFFILVFFPGCDFFSNRVLNKTVVAVDTQRMTVQEFSKALAGKLKNLDALSAKDPQILARFKEKIVSDFIVESLITLWFRDQGLTLAPEELEKELKNYQSGYPDDKSFRLTLSEESVTYAQWKKQVEHSLKRKKAFAMMNQNIAAPTQDELQSYYTNNKVKYQQKEALQLSHILVLDENQAEIVKKLSKTQKFAELIKKFSMSADAPYGGNYGWLERESNTDLEKIFKGHPGEIFGPVKLLDGYHLFRVEQKRTQHQKQLEDVRDQVKNDVFSLRQTAKFSAWLDEQVKRYKVMKNVQAVSGLYVETQDQAAQK